MKVFVAASLISGAFGALVESNPRGKQAITFDGPQNSNYGDFTCYPKDAPTKYKGLKDTAANGQKCANWSDVPEGADKPAENLDLNYCRASSHLAEPWCYTVNELTMKSEARTPDDVAKDVTSSKRVTKMGVGPKQTCGVKVCEATGTFARNFKDEADTLKAETGTGALNCDCADQLYGKTTTTKNTRVSFLQKPGCKCN